MIKYLVSENLQLGSIVSLAPDNTLKKSEKNETQIGVAVEPIPCGSLAVVDSTGLVKLYKFPEASNDNASPRS